MEKNKIFTNGIFVFFAAMLCCALWGSATPFIKMGYELMMPEKDVPSTLLFAGVRFFLAGILTVVIYSIARKKFLYPKKENLGKVLTVSVFQTIIQIFLCSLSPDLIAFSRITHKNLKLCQFFSHSSLSHFDGIGHFKFCIMRHGAFRSC